MFTAAPLPFDPQQQRHRLLFWLVSILALAFAVSGGVAYGVSGAEVRRVIVEHELPLTGESIYSEIQRDILRPVFVSAQMAQNTWLRDWAEAGESDVEPLLRYLRQVKGKNDAVSAFYVSAGTRTYYHPSAPAKQVREDNPNDAWFFRVQKMKDDYEINTDPDAMNQSHLTVFINYKVFGRDDRLLGVTGVGLSSANLVNLIKDYERRYARHILLVDESGGVVLTGDARATSTGQPGPALRLADLPGLSALAPSILNRQATQTRLSYTSAQGTTTFVNSRYVPELRWYVVVEEDEGRAMAPVRHVLVMTAAVGLAALLLTIAVVHVVVRRFQKRLETLATTDELSGLANRRSGERALERALHSARHKARPLGLLVLDIDHFKRVNDTHGHAAGDHVIAEVSRRIDDVVRPDDCVARWGGEEFVVVLRDSDSATTQDVAQRVRQAVAHTLIDVPGRCVAVTVSVGATQWRRGETGACFFARADAALLQAKREGRNRVVVAQACDRPARAASRALAVRDGTAIAGAPQGL